MRLIIKIDKKSDIQEYINKPVLNALDLTIETIGSTHPKVIGVIKEAIEFEDGLQLTIELFDDLVMVDQAIFGNALKCITFGVKS